MEHDIEEGNDVHSSEHDRDAIQAPNVGLPRCCYTDKHEGDTELDGNDSCTIEYLEKEEHLEKSVKASARWEQHASLQDPGTVEHHSVSTRECLCLSNCRSDRSLTG